MTLQKRSVFLISAILFFALGINTSTLTYMASEKYKKAVLSKTVSTGETLLREIGRILILGIPLESIDGMGDKFKKLVDENSDISYVLITDKSAKVLFHSDEKQTGIQLTDDTSQYAADSKEKLIQENDRFYDLSFPVKNADDVLVGVLRIGVRTSVVKEELYDLLTWALVVATVCFLLFALLVFYSVSKFITTPIEEMEQAAKKISEGDLTETINARGKDEIASLGRQINKMSANLKDIISKIMDITASVSLVSTTITEASSSVTGVVDVQKSVLEDTAHSLDDLNTSISDISLSSSSLAESADQTSVAVNEIGSSIAMVAETSGTFNEFAQEAASSVEQMIANIKEIASSLTNLSGSSEETASALLEVNATIREIQQSADESVKLAEKVSNESSEKGMKAVEATVKGMQEIKDSMGSLSEVINRLGVRSEEIGSILVVIDEVTDQTGLLALNAAILAAQAGEHGKSFGVVADEIKNLAERTSSSTKEIHDLISAVQSETKESVKMAEVGLKAVDKGMVVVKDAQSALQSIHKSSNVATEMSRSIQRATSEEANVIKHITESIKGMMEHVEMISRATQEQSKGGRLIVDLMMKIKDLSSQMRKATQEQQDASKQIMDVSENVSLQAEQINNAIGSQKVKSNDIVMAIESVRNTQSQLIESTAEMDKTIVSLGEDASSLLEELKKFNL